jgi:hypothetical protein
MGIWNAIAAPVVSAVSSIGKSHIERKRAKEAIEGNIKMAKVQGENQAKVDIADWERLSKAQEDNTWKDEYITVSLVAPINVIVLDSVLMAMGFGDGSATRGVLAAMATLNQQDIPIGDLMAIAVAAGLSVKLVRGLR